MKTGNLFRRIADFCDKNQPRIEDRLAEFGDKIESAYDFGKSLASNALVASLRRTHKALHSLNEKIELRLNSDDDDNPPVKEGRIEEDL